MDAHTTERGIFEMKIINGAQYIITLPESPYHPSLRRVEKTRTGCYRLVSGAFGWEKLDFITSDEINRGVPVLHYSGDIFVDCEFPPRPACFVDADEVRRLIELNTTRRNTAHDSFLRDVANVRRNAADHYHNLPPDERATVDRLTFEVPVV